MPFPSEIPSEMILRGSEADSIDLEDMANFFRDLVFIHDRIWLAESKITRKYDLSASFFYTRTGRPVPETNRLKLSSIRMASPWEMAIAIGSATAGGAASAWMFFQIARGVLLLPGERRLQRLQEEKLRRELANGTPQSLSPIDEYPRSVDEVIAEGVEEHLLLAEQAAVLEPLIQKDVRRILKSPIKIEELEPRSLVHARWE